MMGSWDVKGMYVFLTIHGLPDVVLQVTPGGLRGSVYSSE